MRRAEDADTAGIVRLYDMCFPGEPQFRTWFFDRVYKSGNTLIYEDGGEIRSAVQTLELTLTASGRGYPAHYIYAAGTDPACRGRGLMARLLDMAFETGRRRGEWFSALITENDALFDFYRPFGYETAARVASFEAQPRETAPGYMLRAAESKDIPALVRIYAEETADVMAAGRDARYFELMLELYGENLLVLDGPGGVMSYAFVEERSGAVFAPECAGREKAAISAAVCNQNGTNGVFQCVPQGESDRRMGCIKPLTPQAKVLLDGLEKPPYLNILFN